MLSHSSSRATWSGLPFWGMGTVWQTHHREHPKRVPYMWWKRQPVEVWITLLSKEVPSYPGNVGGDIILLEGEEFNKGHDSWSQDFISITLSIQVATNRIQSVYTVHDECLPTSSSLMICHICGALKSDKSPSKSLAVLMTPESCNTHSESFFNCKRVFVRSIKTLKNRFYLFSLIFDVWNWV